jgi:hypothetical protein
MDARLSGQEVSALFVVMGSIGWDYWWSGSSDYSMLGAVKPRRSHV